MLQISFNKPVIGLCAFSGSGKTTLLEKLIPILNEEGVKIAVIKHAHHSFDIDHPGKDSYKIRKAGARQILISSRKRWAIVHEHETEAEELKLEEALQKITTENIDLIIVEGFKTAAIPKIEIHRPHLDTPLIAANDEHVVAIATDQPQNVQTSLPVLDLNQPRLIAQYLIQLMNKK